MGSDPGQDQAGVGLCGSLSYVDQCGHAGGAEEADAVEVEQQGSDRRSEEVGAGAAHRVLVGVVELADYG
jgi:hypothetical protein